LKITEDQVLVGILSFTIKKDTDTIGSITGGMAGIIYGYQSCRLVTFGQMKILGIYLIFI